jgi:hypothetical protein
VLLEPLAQGPLFACRRREMRLVLVRVHVFEAAEMLWLKLRLKRPPAEPPATQEYDRQAAPSVMDLDAWYAAYHQLVAYQRSER